MKSSQLFAAAKPTSYKEWPKIGTHVIYGLSFLILGRNIL